MNTQNFYDRLRECYLGIKNTNDAKVFIMRQILEDYFNFLNNGDGDGEKLNFANAQALWRERNKEYRFDREITFIRQEMNRVVHGQKRDISDDTLRIYYEFCVRLINLISEEMPDAATLAAYGHIDENYLDDLNKLQRNAVLDKSRVVYVNAGPGTGKTHLLVYKIADLLIKQKDQVKIVAMSYTRSSASSLTTKIEEVTDRLNIVRFNFPYSGTIHSFSLNSLKSYAKSKGQKFDYVIADDNEIEDIVDDIYYSSDLKFEHEIIREYLLHPELNADEALRSLVEEKKTLYKRISVGEILDLYLKKITEDEEFVKWTSKNMNYLLVDEAQDLTKVNYQILDALLEKVPDLKIFLVGDPRQNIFGFLGGSYKYLDAFLSKYDDSVSRQYLKESYRCPQYILDYTNGLEFDDCENVHLESQVEQDGEICINEFDDEYEEAEEIVRYISSLPDRKSVAILSPRLRPLSRIVDSLNENGIPFVVQGGSHSVKPHIQAFAYLNRIVETGCKSLGPVNGLCEKFEMPKYRNLHEFMHSTLGIEVSRLHGSYVNANMTFLELSRSFVKICRQHIASGIKEEQDKDFKLLYDCVIKKADSPEAFSRLFKYYRTMFSSLEVEFKSASEAPDPVLISTMHSAKGLEWDYVILPCMCDKYFPNPKINDEVDQEAKREHMNSSLKLMFVAATRAKKTLYITYPSRIRDTNSDARPSRYLKDLIL